MQTGAITQYIDVAQVVLYVFWIFFVGLIFYIRQEDRREGYPLEHDTTGKVNPGNFLFIPEPKTFTLPHGKGEATAPNGVRDTRPLKARRTSVTPGSPLEPTGAMPMLDGIGPGSWAERQDFADQMVDGRARIVPMRVAGDFHIAEEDPDIIGWPVYGCDGKEGGTIVDVWVDRSEHLIRYLEVATGEAASGRHVLLPMNFGLVKSGRKQVSVIAITGGQFINVPGTKSDQEITRLEEEKIMAYYGAGYLYATPMRTEPLI
jgi:photosynthetic reaction center H subunit